MLASQGQKVTQQTTVKRPNPHREGKCSHLYSSTPLRQSSLPSHLQNRGMHWPLSPHCHWYFLHLAGGTSQFWDRRGTVNRHDTFPRSRSASSSPSRPSRPGSRPRRRRATPSADTRGCRDSAAARGNEEVSHNPPRQSGRCSPGTRHISSPPRRTGRWHSGTAGSRKRSNLPGQLSRDGRLPERRFRADPSSPTALLFVRAVGAVSLTVAQEVLRDAAGFVVAVLVAAVGQSLTIQLIRAVLTVALPVAHLPLRDAPVAMGTLELSWDRTQALREAPNYGLIQ